MSVLVRVAATATAALFLAGCGAHSSSSATSPAVTSTAHASASSAPSGARITITSFAFTTPASVKPGEKVTVTNSDAVGHTVTADDGSSFNVSVGANATATLTAPSKPGTYAFHCVIHPQMHGTLVVKN